jgi:hypothetical protein
MSWIDRLERKFGWLAFPGFLRYYAMLHAVVFVLQFFRPGIGELLEFDRQRILGGEVWRVITFLFASSGLGGVGGFAVLFFVFMVMIAFMMNDALENAWGEFKTSLFFYAGIIGLIVANFLLDTPTQGSGFQLYGAAFLAFATLYPTVTFLVLFVIPVQVKYLAWIQGGLMILSCLGNIVLLPFFLLSFANYLIWAGIPALRGQAKVVESAQRRKRFLAQKTPVDAAFHQCAKCGKTDLSDPALEFRVGKDGQEYCEEHLETSA